MDSGAPSVRTAPNPTTLADVVPPHEWPFVRKVGFAGVGMAAVAAVLGMAAAALGDSAPSLIATARLFLVFFAALAAGAAVSMRPDLWQAWTLGALTAALGVAGLPGHWDSFRLLFGVMAAIALVWSLCLLAPARYRVPFLSAVILFHFGGILLATTSPPPTPWVTEQAFIRVYNPYLQFLYLRNAYHFYSPQPGPASLLVFLLKTEVGTDPSTGEKKYETKWVILPRRPGDVKDPLGLTYYRYLAVTEQVAHGTPGLRANTAEAQDMRLRRQNIAISLAIPFHPTDEPDLQYQLPQPDVARYVVPSYASHVIMENTRNKEEAARTTVKVYRLQHNTMGIDEFINWRKVPGPVSDPYHPMTYRPFFFGEFNARGDLIDPQEPMLYWLVPITPRPGGAPAYDPEKRAFLDYMSFHALGPSILGPNTTVDQLGEKRFKNLVFDWSQLR